MDEENRMKGRGYLWSYLYNQLKKIGFIGTILVFEGLMARK